MRQVTPTPTSSLAVVAAVAVVLSVGCGKRNVERASPDEEQAVATATTADRSGQQAAEHASSDEKHVGVATATTADRFYLESAELSAQKSRASNGDADAAFRVATHYSMALADVEGSLPWLRLAANGGHFVAMQNLAVTLIGLGGEERCAEAVRWLERAKREGSPDEVRRFQVVELSASLKLKPETCRRK